MIWLLRPLHLQFIIIFVVLRLPNALDYFK